MIIIIFFSFNYVFGIVYISIQTRHRIWMFHINGVYFWIILFSVIIVISFQKLIIWIGIHKCIIVDIWIVIPIRFVIVRFFSCQLHSVVNISFLIHNDFMIISKVNIFKV